MRHRDDNPTPLVSVLSISNRPAFWPWLAWNYNRQTYRQTELVLVYEVPESRDEHPMRADFRLTEHGTGFYPVEKGLSRAEMRNRAVSHARGDIVVWFDDDDWQHPERIQWAVDALRDGADWVGASTGFFVELRAGTPERAAAYKYPSRIPRAVAITLGTWASFARMVPFKETHYEDTAWAEELTAHRLGVVDMAHLHQFWLQHPLSTNRRPELPWSEETFSGLRTQLAGAWDDTDAQLAALRERLGV